jgi:predicted dehydrogenase
MTAPIRVGIVGANPDRGWAFRAHVPALTALDRFRVTAVATTREESAARAAQAAGATHAFTSAGALAACADVDLVVVTVRAPEHHRLAEQVTAAGKHLLVEWPQGASTRQAEQIASLVDAAGVRGFVGLQTRADPVVRWAREVVDSGVLGDLLAISIRSTRLKGVGGVVAGFSPYTLDKANGAGNTEIHGGHLLDLVTYVVASADISRGTTSLVRDTFRDAGGGFVTATAPDVLTADLRVGRRGLGTLVAVDGDPVPATHLLLLGTDGRLELATDGEGESFFRQPQMAAYHGRLTTADATVERTSSSNNLPVEARNVAALYNLVADDLLLGTKSAPTATDAVAIHRLLDRLTPARQPSPC